MQQGWEIILSQRIHITKTLRFLLWLENLNMLGGCTGEVIYVSLDEERQWQPGELEIFQELTRTMAIFVSLRYRVTESREQISSIQKKDPLTGLYNQEAFREAVVEILAHSKPDEVYAIEYMDINNFWIYQ